jgi:hypothetical protein
VSVAGYPADFCRERRRAEAIAKGLNGIDFVDVADDRQTLSVYFFLAAPKGIGHRFYRVMGGTHVRDLKVVEVQHAGGDDPERENCLKIRVDRKGDYSTYRLEAVDRAGGPAPGFDPLFASIAFTFGRAPGIAIDCAARTEAPQTPPAAEPELNYLSKDFDSFRQLILDRLALNVPAWSETHLPDIGVTLVDLLAYVADQLSYQQDAITTEAYLDTARFRISARRHARLLDYAIQEGCNARTWISLETDADLAPSDAWFGTAGNAAVFEPVTAVNALAAYRQIDFYTWGDTVRSLPAGATRATLCNVPASATTPDPTAKGPLDDLIPGRFLLFEEVLGAATGSPLDADPAHRCVVRLTSVRSTVDPVYEAPVVEIAWSVEDRLPFELTLSMLDASGASVPNISIARGNVFLVDHGRTLPAAENAGAVPASGAFRPKLAQPNLTYRAVPNLDVSAAAAMTQDPREATAQIVEMTSTLAGLQSTSWTARYDLLESAPDDADFVVEMDDERYANLRFGDGILGAQPEPGALFQARYRIGNGTAGNVGAETIVQLNTTSAIPPGANLVVRNPLAASGGTDPEPLSQIKLLAPQAYNTELVRAVTAADYATLAERNPAVFQAAAVLRWSGARPAVRVAIDPLGTETVSPALLDSVAQELETFRSIGQDLEVVPATYVPIDLALEVMVLPGYARGQVAAALLDAFSNRVLPDGTLGVFHPENLGFGLALSENGLIAAAQAVTGVQTVSVVRLARLLDESQRATPSSGTLSLGPLEVARLDNDPAAPEHGRFRLHLAGGR